MKKQKRAGRVFLLAAVLLGCKQYVSATAAVLLGVLALVLYIAAGRTSFDPNYSVLAFVGMGAGIVLGIAGSIIRWRPLSFLSYLSFLYGFIQYLVSQANLIANIFYDVDGSTFPPAFYATLAASAGAVVLALVAGIVMKPIQDKQ